MISNKTKRNISGILVIIGAICLLARLFNVCLEPNSGKAWFELFGITVLLGLCIDNFRIFSRRVKKGIKFGNNKTNSYLEN